MNSTTSTLWTGPFPIQGVYGQFSLLIFFVDISIFKAISVDPDQTPRHAASDLDLHCLPMSLLRDARLKWVNDAMGKLRWRMQICERRCCHIKRLD